MNQNSGRLTHFKYDNNAVYLPLMYFLPRDLITQCPTLHSLPRKVREVIYSDEMMGIVNSDQFLNEIADSVALLAFPHFGFRGWKEHYTGYFPVWQLSYSLQVWRVMLEREIGWNLQALINIPSVQSISFFEDEDITETMSKVVKRGIKEKNWQPILDIIEEMPCAEDFEPHFSYARADFIRKWYHTRVENVKMVSLEACIEKENDRAYQIPDQTCDVSGQVLGEDFYQRFKATLTDRDMAILELRVQGFTYEKIAENLGYQNHSGVLKRMRRITQAFQAYEAEDQ